MKQGDMMKFLKKYRTFISVLVEWGIHILGYGMILLAISVLFPHTIHIDNAHFGMWGFLSSFIIFILNKTIKPIIFWLTIPITALTLGLFYPFINVFILHIVHFILGSHFTIHGIFMSFFVALLISIMNQLMDHLVIEPLLEREKTYE